VAGAHQAGADGAVQRAHQARGELEVHGGHRARVRGQAGVEGVGAAELGLGAPHEVEQVARLLQIHGGCLAHVGHDRQGGDQERGRDRRAGALRVAVLVVERVLAGDEGRAPELRHVAARDGGSDESCQPIGLARIAPAEIVEQRRLVRISADRDHVADRLVACG
jgi:hypothetical protein